MPTSLLPTYPSEKDIRYGVWLKHFALHLPTYAHQYDLSVWQLFEVTCLASEYLDLLIWRLQYTTASIVQRRQPALVLIDAQAVACEVTSQHARARAIKDTAALVVAHLQCHPTYTTCDGQILQLDTV